MGREVNKIGKYIIIRLLTKGGMGAIYLAKHPTLNREVILKKLTFRGNREIRERFKREAEIMMDLRNENIVTVYDHFKEGSSYYLVLEYIDGLSLEEIILRDGALDSADVSLIAYDLARALSYIHSKGIIHRDIKPGNVIIDREGHIKLTDFGIASTGECDILDLKSKLEILGTPNYMSPEQLHDFKNIDIQSDIYSFSVLLYEMLTGLKPFMGEVNDKLFSQILKGKYYKIKKMNKAASHSLSGISRKGMNRKKRKRFRDFDIISYKLKNYIKRNSEKVHRKSISSLIDGKEIVDDFKQLLKKQYITRSLKKKKRAKTISVFLLIIFIVMLSIIFGIPQKAVNSKATGGFSISLKGYEESKLPKKNIKYCFDLSIRHVFSNHYWFSNRTGLF